jgi:hypothetical protein
MVAPLQKKLSVKTVFGKPTRKDIPTEDGAIKWLMRAVCICTGFKTGNSDFGPWIALTGMFKCTNVQTGEEFRGSKLFLPDLLADPVSAQLSQTQGTVEFVAKVGIRARDDSPVGYEYVADLEVDPASGAGGDPFASLEEKAAGNLLPAPKADAGEDASKPKVSDKKRQTQARRR